MARIAGLLAALVLVASTGTSAAANPQPPKNCLSRCSVTWWQTKQRHRSFPLYRPTQTLRQPLSDMDIHGSAINASYGAFHSKHGLYVWRGFSVTEGWPSLGSYTNPNHWRTLGHHTVDGRRGTLGVYCRPKQACNDVQAGFTFRVTLRSPKGQRTLVELDSSDLTKSQFLSVAKSLRSVTRR